MSHEWHEWVVRTDVCAGIDSECGDHCGPQAAARGPKRKFFQEFGARASRVRTALIYLRAITFVPTED